MSRVTRSEARDGRHVCEVAESDSPDGLTRPRHTFWALRKAGRRFGKPRRLCGEGRRVLRECFGPFREERLALGKAIRVFSLARSGLQVAQSV